MIDDMAESAGTKAYRELRNRILDGRLKPSASYLETELADEIGVSRTPIREASLRLEREGLVSVRPRRGIQILPISAEDMAEIYQVLSVLEPLAAELAARRGLSTAEMEAMDAATSDMEQALAAEDLPRWAEADDRFHALLVLASGNRRLVETASRYRALVHRARMATLTLRPAPTQSAADHRTLLACLSARDPEGAHAIHSAHRKAAGNMLTALLARHHLDNL